MGTISPKSTPTSRASRMLRLVLQALAALLVSVLVGVAAAPARARSKPIPAEVELATLGPVISPYAQARRFSGHD